jgi:hypothetical protein
LDKIFTYTSQEVRKIERKDARIKKSRRLAPQISRGWEERKKNDNNALLNFSPKAKLARLTQGGANGSSNVIAKNTLNK